MKTLHLYECVPIAILLLLVFVTSGHTDAGLGSDKSEKTLSRIEFKQLPENHGIVSDRSLRRRYEQYRRKKAFVFYSADKSATKQADKIKSFKDA